jgi:hypothetical protein
MYSIEYKCTKRDTKLITQHITAVRLSNKNPQLTFRIPESIQFVYLTYAKQLLTEISQNIKAESKKPKLRHRTERSVEPLDPNFLPSSPAKLELSKGKAINSTYIFFKVGFLIK